MWCGGSGCQGTASIFYTRKSLPGKKFLLSALPITPRYMCLSSLYIARDLGPLFLIVSSRLLLCIIQHHQVYDRSNAKIDKLSAHINACADRLLNVSDVLPLVKKLSFVRQWKDVNITTCRLALLAGNSLDDGRRRVVYPDNVPCTTLPRQPDSLPQTHPHQQAA